MSDARPKTDDERFEEQGEAIRKDLRSAPPAPHPHVKPKPDDVTERLSRAFDFLATRANHPELYGEAVLAYLKDEQLWSLLAEAERRIETLEAERDEAREDCGHAKAMYKFVGEERDRFVRLRMDAEKEIERLDGLLKNKPTPKVPSGS